MNVCGCVAQVAGKCLPASAPVLSALFLWGFHVFQFFRHVLCWMSDLLLFDWI